MKFKKIFLALVAMLLVSAVSIAVTVAALKGESNKVVNTFSMEGLFNTSSDVNFQLLEKPVTTDKNGNYVLDEDGQPEDEGITYENLFPNMTIYKNPYISLQNKSDVDAWLYIEVKENGSNIFTDSYTNHVATTWNMLNGVTGENGGQVFVLSSVIDGENPNLELPFFDQSKLTFTVKDFETPPGDYSLTFYAYMCQTDSSMTEAKAFCEHFEGQIAGQ